MKLALGRRRIVLIAGLAAIALIATVFWLSHKPEPASVRINFYTVLRVRDGMTRGDLEGIFHVPSGEYSLTPDPNSAIEPTGSTRRKGLKWESWGGDSAVLSVHFGPDGRVDDWEVRVRPAPAKPALEDWFEMIKYQWLRM